MKSMIRSTVIAFVLLVMMMILISCKSNESKKLEAQKIEYVSQINGLQTKLDSLNTILDSLRLDNIDKIVVDLRKDNDSLKQSNKNLNNIINHQNQMINDLKKKY